MVAKGYNYWRDLWNISDLYIQIVWVTILDNQFALIFNTIIM